MKLNWVTLKVSQLEQSLAFYTGLLNLEVAERFGNEQHQIVMLGQADQAKIELIWEAGETIEAGGAGVSIGLEADDFDGMLATVKENGMEVVGPIAPTPKIRFFFIKDPDGYTIQLVEQA